MKSKGFGNTINAILSLLAVILLILLFIMARLASREGYQNLLLATPSGLNAQTLDEKKLQELSEDEFLLTYEIRQNARARAVNSAHSVTLIATNQNYAGIMGYLSLDGGFFTKSAYDAKSKHAVLNETAAFGLFGSNNISGKTLKLNDDTWIIAGVINDGDDDNSNIYVPSSISGGLIQSVMALLDSHEITEAYAKNALKSLGVHDNTYDFINLSKSASAFDERFLAALKSALFALCLILAFESGKKLLLSFRFYKDSLDKLYFRELLSGRRAELLKTAAALLLFAAGITGALVLSLQILAVCLTWQDTALIAGRQTAGDFGEKLIRLQKYQWLDIFLFAGCVLAILARLLRYLTKAGADK